MPSPDSKQLDALFREAEADLKSYVGRRLGKSGASEVDDIVQESFLRVSAQAGEEPLGNPRGFLFRTARNLIIDLSRRRKVRNDNAAAIKDDPHREDADRLSPERSVGSQQDLALIMAAIDDLPPACRRAFLLQRREDLSYAEVARRLDISESMVQKHMSKALCHLYKVLP